MKCPVCNDTTSDIAVHLRLTHHYTLDQIIELLFKEIYKWEKPQ